MRSWIVMIALAALVAGCASNPLPFGKKDPGPLPEDQELVQMEALSFEDPGLLPATNQRFPDVPLPMNVEEDVDRSYVYESSVLRVGRMVYTTRETMNALARFYVRECQQIGWNLESCLQANGYELVYKKADMKLVVSIRDTGLRRGRLLVLNLTPDK
ncbi:MAG TPA: hypothetical protein PLO37_12770 [Candidatus Hydrogenedentes bacterium]|nr:hypothetical protein [Candidatus Hydrogenedentota bacterium]HPG67715.1 hypothetical protein [Candidatus Hydrogenedentota bacterium]